MKVRYIGYGIGNRVGDTIYLNKKLKKYPELHKAILRHERKHSGSWDIDDFLMDVEPVPKRLRGQYKSFILKHPSSLLNYLPILKLGDVWAVDLSITIIWVMAIAFSLLIFILL